MPVIDARLGYTPDQQYVSVDTRGGQAARQLGQTVQATAEESLRRIELTDSTAAQASAAQMRLELHERFQQYTTDPSKDFRDPNYAADFITDADNELERFRTGMSTKAGNDTLSAIKLNLMAEYGSKMSDHVAMAHGQKAKADLLLVNNANANLLMRAPEQFVPIMQEQTLLLSQNPHLTDPQKQELLAVMRSSLGSAAVRGIGTVDPSEAITQLSRGDWDVWLDPSERASLASGFAAKIVSDRNQAYTLAERERKRRDEEAIKEIMTMDEENKLSIGWVKMQQDVLSPSNYKLAIALATATEPEVDRGETVIELQWALDNDPALVQPMAIAALRNGEIKGATARAYSNTAYGRLRDQGFKSPRERAMADVSRFFEPKMMDRYNPSHEAQRMGALREIDMLTQDPNLTPEEAQKIADRVIRQWATPRNVAGFEMAPSTTNLGVLKGKYDQLVSQALELKARYDSQQDPQLQTIDQLQAASMPLQAQIRDLRLRIDALER